MLVRKSKNHFVFAQVFFLTSEEARLSLMSETYKELLRLDVQLVKHTSELEDFEHTSKQDRAKAFTGKLVSQGLISHNNHATLVS